MVKNPPKPGEDRAAIAAFDFSHLDKTRVSARDNDTLCGLLKAYEREDEKHLRGKLGYWEMVEKRMIRQNLIELGHDPKDLGFEFKVNEIVNRNHSKDVTYREISERRIAAKAASGDPPEFNREELQYLADIFADANNPVAQSICLKAREILR